jgi:cell division septation protein DedD
MKTLATYIEYLVMTRHYAFVPGLGGFMVRTCPAQVASRTDEQGVAHMVLTPPRQEMVFNRFMAHDDGQLVSALMEFEGMSFDDAEACIRREVEGWKAALERREPVAMGAWGRLEADEECHWVFSPTADDAQLTCRASHYGLESFEMNGWQEPKATTTPIAAPLRNHREEAETHQTRIVLPFSRTVLQRVAMIVLILACCLVGFFLPSHRRQSDNQLAGMVDSDILTGVRLPNVTDRHSWEEIWDEEVARLEWEQTADVAALAADSLTEESTTADLAASELATPDAEAVDDVAPTATVPTTLTADAAPAETKLYYIIIGSCADRDEADRLLRRLGEAGVTDAGVLLKDNRYRICLRAYDDRATAEQTLTEVREVERLHDAWLLPARQATVTYISKIKYNEQLPMELSHLTTRTQRDQGGDHS